MFIVGCHLFPTLNHHQHDSWLYSTRFVDDFSSLSSLQTSNFSTCSFVVYLTLMTTDDDDEVLGTFTSLGLTNFVCKYLPFHFFSFLLETLKVLPCRLDFFMTRVTIEDENKRTEMNGKRRKIIRRKREKLDFFLCVNCAGNEWESWKFTCRLWRRRRRVFRVLQSSRSHFSVVIQWFVWMRVERWKIAHENRGDTNEWEKKGKLVKLWRISTRFSSRWFFYSYFRAHTKERKAKKNWKKKVFCPPNSNQQRRKRRIQNHHLCYAVGWYKKRTMKSWVLFSFFWVFHVMFPPTSTVCRQKRNWVVVKKNNDNRRRTIGGEQLKIYNLFMMMEWN